MMSGGVQLDPQMVEDEAVVREEGGGGREGEGLAHEGFPLSQPVVPLFFLSSLRPRLSDRLMCPD